MNMTTNGMSKNQNQTTAAPATKKKQNDDNLPFLRLEKLTHDSPFPMLPGPHLFSSQVDFVDLTSPPAHRQGTRTPKGTPRSEV